MTFGFITCTTHAYFNTFLNQSVFNTYTVIRVQYYIIILCIEFINSKKNCNNSGTTVWFSFRQWAFENNFKSLISIIV